MRAIQRKSKRTLLLLIILACSNAFSEELADTGEYGEDEYYDFDMDEGITIYENRQLQAVEDTIIAKMNGTQKEREEFIKNDLLVKSGFRSTANRKYRKTTGEEKALSALHGIARGFLDGIPIKLFSDEIPLKPFFEEEYGKLPKGEFYSFESVIYFSGLNEVSPKIRNILNLEYMFQIEFGGGILIQNWNVNYYTDDNINKFSKLAEALPDFPPEIKQIKDRYLYVELPKIKAALERYKNPNELTIQAKKNLGW
jgi:hypothetical protein